ncbi:hypothetical protein [Hymenobacter sp. UYCo722]|uniref:hypothetical protein n=1 Tax=Hymenobacter sp. UYCo722 TaxID=3156335 RepID=UPI0033950A01
MNEKKIALIGIAYITFLGMLFAPVFTACNSADNIREPSHKLESKISADSVELSIDDLYTIADTIHLDSEKDLLRFEKYKYYVASLINSKSNLKAKEAIVILMLKINHSYLKAGYLYPNILSLTGECSAFGQTVLKSHPQLAGAANPEISNWETYCISSKTCIICDNCLTSKNIYLRNNKIKTLYTSCVEMERQLSKSNIQK